VAAKVTPASVHYRAAPGPRSAQRCGTCIMYRPYPNQRRGLCTIVVGLVQPAGVCDRWSPKQQANGR
jgi:hypothetical protein